MSSTSGELLDENDEVQQDADLFGDDDDVLDDFGQDDDEGKGDEDDAMLGDEADKMIDEEDANDDAALFGGDIADIDKIDEDAEEALDEADEYRTEEVFCMPEMSVMSVQSTQKALHAESDDLRPRIDEVLLEEGSQCYLLTLPPFIAVEHEEFDVESYTRKVENMSDEEREVEAQRWTIRWRRGDDGSAESNTQLVPKGDKWCLHVGETVFELRVLPMANSEKYESSKSKSSASAFDRPDVDLEAPIIGNTRSTDLHAAVQCEVPLLEAHTLVSQYVPDSSPEELALDETAPKVRVIAAGAPIYSRLEVVPTPAQQMRAQRLFAAERKLKKMAKVVAKVDFEVAGEDFEQTAKEARRQAERPDRKKRTPTKRKKRKKTMSFDREFLEDELVGDAELDDAEYDLDGDILEDDDDDDALLAAKDPFANDSEDDEEEII
ncbi:MAG: hypothetical protein MHM6MM_004021 [Cercozoa sp. M6MM]